MTTHMELQCALRRLEHQIPLVDGEYSLDWSDPPRQPRLAISGGSRYRYISPRMTKRQMELWIDGMIKGAEILRHGDPAAPH
jgi:hypothetical protein